MGNQPRILEIELVDSLANPPAKNKVWLKEVYNKFPAWDQNAGGIPAKKHRLNSGAEIVFSLR